MSAKLEIIKRENVFIFYEIFNFSLIVLKSCEKLEIVLLFGIFPSATKSLIKKKVVNEDG